MKILVDINNKILKVLENDRSIFKGEQSADKLILYINQQLVNEYPVITGLLSNGRRIGPFTTDSSYGTETIDGTTYTTAEFTLSKENGFTLTEGNTQVTIWIYKTKDTEVISKTAIGNVTFNVVNTTSFNDGDIIISGDVEGTVVNLKVELENLQSSVNAVNSRVNDLNGVVVKKTIEDISTGKTLQELYDEYGSCFVGKVGYNKSNILFLFYTSTTQTNLTVCYDSKLKTYKNVNMNLNVASLLDDSLGNPTDSNSYTDKKIDELIVAIDMGTFATNRPIEEGLKEFFIAAENLNLGYYDNRIFIGMVADTKVMAIGQAGGDLAVYTEKFEQYIVGYDDDDLLAVRHEPSKVRNIGAFETSTIEDGLKQFALEVVRNHINYNKYGSTTCLYTGEIAGDIPVFTWYNDSEDVMNVFAPNTTYKVSNILDEENITITDISSYTKTESDSLMSQKADKDKTYTKTEVDNKIWQVNDDMANNYMELESMIEESRNEIEDRENLVSIIGNATESLAGVMSANDKKNLNTLVALLQDDSNNVVDTIKEVLAIFNQYPEGANLVSALSGKADKAATDNLLADKVNETTYNAKVEELEENISDLDNIKIEIDSLTAKNNIKNYQEILWLGSDNIILLPTQLPYEKSTDLITFLEGLKTLWSDIDSNLIEQYGYNRVVFLALSGGKLVKVEIVKESSGNYALRVHSSIYKDNVKELIALQNNFRYRIYNDEYDTPATNLNKYLTPIDNSYTKATIDQKFNNIRNEFKEGISIYKNESFTNDEFIDGAIEFDTVNTNFYIWLNLSAGDYSGEYFIHFEDGDIKLYSDNEGMDISINSIISGYSLGGTFDLNSISFEIPVEYVEIEYVKGNFTKSYEL